MRRLKVLSLLERSLATGGYCSGHCCTGMSETCECKRRIAEGKKEDYTKTFYECIIVGGIIASVSIFLRRRYL